ncbi:MAG: glycerate kinase [Desulfobacterales bacterium]|jgi:hydroxypyruvate reductase
MSSNLKKLRQHARHIFEAGLQAVDPVAAINDYVTVRENVLRIGDQRFDLREYDRILIVGAGKAVAPMAQAMQDQLGNRIADGIIVTKDDHGLPLKKIKVCEASHPVPDARGVAGTEEILALVENATERDLVICLISGGGSALLIAPVEEISLADKQHTTKLLLACGATIHEFNTVRKHLSRAKGGRLAQKAYPATVTSLILSDVVGDDLDVIASGPTVPDPSTFHDAEQILKGYGIWDQLPANVRNHIERGSAGQIEDTPKSDHMAFQRCSQVLVGTNLQALAAAGKAAKRLGYRPLILSSKIEGEAREVAKFYTAVAKEVLSSNNPMEPPVCVLAGGETTVTISGEGRGGRNQEFALAAAMAIDGVNKVVVLSGGTDGTDGPTDAAGALADGMTLKRARDENMDPKDFLRRNDSYRFFKQLDDLVITGPTRTNVMDIYMLLIGRDG